MEFVRRFHKVATNAEDTEPRGYQLRCRFDGMMTRAPRLRVNAEVPNHRYGMDVWSGLFQKQ
jgi:hypothetical protein